MRLGIFSDVHANLEALNAVLQAYQEYDIDAYYCGGDIVGYGPNPVECMDIIQDVVAGTVLGNHDAAVCGRMDYSYYYNEARDVLDWHRKSLSKKSMKYLKELPYELNVEGASVRLYHGSPYEPEAFHYMITTTQAELCVPMYDKLAHLNLVGHSHLCKVFEISYTGVRELPPTKFTLREDRKYVINVGSVGQPRDYDTRASFTIFDTETKEFEFQRVRYDVEKVSEKIFASPSDNYFGERLLLGV